MHEHNILTKIKANIRGNIFFSLKMFYDINYLLPSHLFILIETFFSSKNYGVIISILRTILFF